MKTKRRNPVAVMGITAAAIGIVLASAGGSAGVASNIVTVPFHINVAGA